MKPIVLLTDPIHPVPANIISARAELRLAPGTDAGITEDSMRRMGETVAHQTLQLLDGQLPAHFVNHDARPEVLRRLQTLSQS
ncbi:MAG: hypothetical protein ACREX0_13940 [Noviherbaspirillum sp.]